VLFHNGREVDAEAVKLNIEHIKDPAIGSDWHRGAIETIERAEVLDKYTVPLALESAACRRAVQRAALPDQPAGPGQL
jgi:ABC-type transport system substrate-binding protein